MTDQPPSQTEQFLGAAEPEPEPEAPVPEVPQQAEPPEQAPEPAPEPEATTPEEQPKGPEEPFDLAKAESELLRRFEALFPVSDEDTLLLRSEPEKVLPKMAAAATYASIRQTIAYLGANLPALVEQILHTKEARTSAEDKFWAAHPELDRTKHRDTLVRFGQAYRTANPTASIDQFIKDVGLMVAAAHGVLAKPAAAATADTLPPPAPVSGPVQHVGAAPKKPAKAADPLIEQFMQSLKG